LRLYEQYKNEGLIFNANEECDGLYKTVELAIQERDRLNSVHGKNEYVVVKVEQRLTEID
jgi:hypothetical protein